MQIPFPSWKHAGVPSQNERDGGFLQKQRFVKTAINCTRRFGSLAAAGEFAGGSGESLQPNTVSVHNPQINLAGMDAALHVHNPAGTPASCILPGSRVAIALPQTEPF